MITIKSWFQVSIPLQHGRGFPSSQFKVLKSGSDEACDVQVFDVEKCFDSLWVQECINTLYENGFKNDKLVLLYEETKNAKIAIKTPNGTTTRKDIKNIIMQGTVFGSLICTSVMDKLAKIFYQNHHLMRTILDASLKIAIEFLFLETGALPVKYVITSRRLNYLKHIHMLEDHELVRRIYQAQRDDPRKGDWWEAAKNDLETFDIDEDKLKQLNKKQAKKYIKEQIYVKAFTDLKLLKANHSKVKHIKYEKFETQEYLKSPKYTFKEASTLLALRSRTVNNIKANTRLFSQNDLLCPLCLKDEDTQEHCLNCPKLIRQNENHLEYNDIFSSNESVQHEIANQFVNILERRQLLQDGRPGTETRDPALY